MHTDCAPVLKYATTLMFSLGERRRPCRHQTTPSLCLSDQQDKAKNMCCQSHSQLSSAAAGDGMGWAGLVWGWQRKHVVGSP